MHKRTHRADIDGVGKSDWMRGSVLPNEAKLMSKDVGFFERRWRAQHPHLRGISLARQKSETYATLPPPREEAGEERPKRKNKPTAIPSAKCINEPTERRE